jgi:hypothetical protein
MEEKYLHLIWEMKRLPSNDLTTVDGVKIQIISFGIRNDDLAGPDFFYGKVSYDGITHFGMIEIHVKSSDWYRHGHQTDSRYNNVILHVVYEYDKPVIQNGVEIPTIELKPFIEKEHYLKFQQGRLASLPILCRNQLQTISSIYLESMKSRALIDKLSQKVELINSKVGNDPIDVLYAMITLAFGTGRNKNGFERLLQHLPRVQVFHDGKLRKREYTSEACAILSDYGNTSEWNYKGLRPQGKPDVRLEQLILTLNSLDMNQMTSISSAKQLENECFGFVKRLDLTPFIKDQILINAIVPFSWSRGIQLKDERYNEIAIEMLERIRAEDKKVMRQWKKQGVHVKTAYDSQALLGLYRHHCSRKKCLSCDVGMKLLKS